MLRSQQAQDELDRLATLPFSFDMNDSESSKSSSSPIESESRRRRQTASTNSTDSPPSFAMPPSDNTMTVNYPPLDSFTLMNATSFPGQSPSSPHTVNPPIMSNNSFAGFPSTQPLLPQYQQQQFMIWPLVPQQPFASNLPLAGGPTAFVNSHPPVHSYPSATAGTSRPTLQHVSPVASTPPIHSPTSSIQEQSPIDPEEAAVVEDKRRRNTAASARFRIKKKQKNLNLERTVSDLTSRAKELEREASSLRRENSWLKEMVMMKGRRNLLENGRYHEKVSSDSGSDSREDDAEESSDNDHVKKNKAKKKGKIKADTDSGNGKPKGKGK